MLLANSVPGLQSWLQLGGLPATAELPSPTPSLSAMTNSHEGSAWAWQHDVVVQVIYTFNCFGCATFLDYWSYENCKPESYHVHDLLFILVLNSRAPVSMSAIFCNGLQLGGFHCQQKQGQGRTCPEKLWKVVLPHDSSLQILFVCLQFPWELWLHSNMANWAWSWGRALVTSGSYRLKEKFLWNRRKSPEHNITIIHFLWTRCRGIPKHGEELLAGHALSIRTYLKHQKYKWNLISHDPNIYIEAVTRTFGPTGGFPGDRVEILVLTVHWLAAKGPNIQFLQTALYCISWPQKSQRQCKRIFQEARTRNMFRPGCITIITIIVYQEKLWRSNHNWFTKHAGLIEATKTDVGI